jgi:DNA-binding beta-propeller fold protein YncE
VADEIDEIVVCVDLRTNRVLTVLPLDGRPTKLALTEFPNPDRSTLEVLIPDHQSMVSIDLRTRTVIGTIPVVAVGAQPVAMTETERTLTLWVANRGDNTVTLIDSDLPKGVKPSRGVDT